MSNSHLGNLSVMTSVLTALEAVPDIELACRRVMDAILRFPAARAAILVRPRPEEHDERNFIVEVFGERGATEAVRFTPRPEAVESACSEVRTYVSPDSPHVVCVPVITSDGVRGAVYFESNGVDSEFIADQTDCLESIAESVSGIIEKSEQISDLEEGRRWRYEELRTRHKMVGEGPAMRALQAGMRNAAAGDGPVLILGEDGTGKQLIAFGIHDVSSRTGLAFMPLVCRDVDDAILRRALLGDSPAFYWGPQGTVFFREISILALPVQEDLLKILRDKSSPVRVMASTESDLDEEIARGTFLPELAEELAAYTLLAPALRERAEDIPLLVDHFFKKYRRGYKVTGISPEAMEILCSSWWPHNAVNLDLGINQAIMKLGSGIIRPEDLPEWLTQAPLLMSEEKRRRDAERRLATDTLRRKAILRRLRQNGGDADDAALFFGVLPEVVQAPLKQDN